jgi:hypothetical protein
MPYGGNQRQPFGLCLGEQHAIEISQMLAALTNTICFLAFYQRMGIQQQTPHSSAKLAKAQSASGFYTGMD